VLLPIEARAVAALRQNGVVEDEQLKQSTKLDETLLRKLRKGRKRIQSGERGLVIAGEGAYRSMVAYYCARAQAMRLQIQDVVEHANQFSAAIGLRETPVFEAKVATKLGIVGLHGVRIDDAPKRKTD